MARYAGRRPAGQAETGIFCCGNIIPQRPGCRSIRQECRALHGAIPVFHTLIPQCGPAGSAGFTRLLATGGECLEHSGRRLEARAIRPHATRDVSGDEMAHIRRPPRPTGFDVDGMRRRHPNAAGEDDMQQPGAGHGGRGLSQGLRPQTRRLEDARLVNAARDLGPDRRDMQEHNQCRNPQRPALHRVQSAPFAPWVQRTAPQSTRCKVSSPFGS